MSVTTLKPGLLVSLKTSLEGGVQYTRTDLNADKERGDGAAVERWETVKVTTDPEEHARATKVRGKVSSIIRSVCSHSAFGLLCPVSREEELDKAIAEARELTNYFNESASTVHLSVYVLKGRIAESDSEAARAISGELRDLLTGMQEGIAEADVEKIREAANKAKKLGGMLDESAGRKVSAAIEEAREVAREIVKKATKKGEDVGAYVASVKAKAIEEARFSFLDLEETKKPEGGEGGAPLLPVAAPRALDIDDETTTVEDEPSETDPSNDLKMVAASGDSRKLDL